MIPRSRVDTVHIDDPVTDVLSRMGTGHTRYPVVGTSSDDLRGFIHLHDLLDGAPTGTVGARLRSAIMVPESLSLPEVVAQLGAAKEEMALVVDEYGGFAGIVTIEDIAEELVGEIADEHDPGTESEIVAEGDGWLVAGDLHLDEIERLLDLHLPDGDYETIAGLVIATFGGLPEIGDQVEITLPRNGADCASEDRPPARTVVAEVRGVAKRVPSSVFMTVHTDKDATHE